MIKYELRKIYKEKRKNLSWSEKNKSEDLLLINFQKLELPFVNYVHTYLAVEELNEIDTEPILRYLKFINPGLRVAVPKINTITGIMTNHIYDHATEFIINSFGIPEPLNSEEINANDIDLVITPLLAFDMLGYRVGYGKGYYDKFFKQCRSDVIKTGLSYFEPEALIDGINQFDIPLTSCVTPENIYIF